MPGHGISHPAPRGSGARCPPKYARSFGEQVLSSESAHASGGLNLGEGPGSIGNRLPATGLAHRWQRSGRKGWEGRCPCGLSPRPLRPGGGCALRPFQHFLPGWPRPRKEAGVRFPSASLSAFSPAPLLLLPPLLPLLLSRTVPSSSSSRSPPRKPGSPREAVVGRAGWFRGPSSPPPARPARRLAPAWRRPLDSQPRVEEAGGKVGQRGAAAGPLLCLEWGPGCRGPLPGAAAGASARDTPGTKGPGRRLHWGSGCWEKPSGAARVGCVPLPGHGAGRPGPGALPSTSKAQHRKPELAGAHHARSSYVPRAGSGRLPPPELSPPPRPAPWCQPRASAAWRPPGSVFLTPLRDPVP